jgi:pimeloyl-ACP methyl ester carboxylesterase
VTDASQKRRYAYLHGFASSPAALKGVALASRFAGVGVTLERPDLNAPSFACLSHAAMLKRVDELAGTDPTPFCLIGSSLGGWLAARWAELHPTRVARLLLLCPGFGLAERWPEIFGPRAMAAWEQTGSLLVPDASGRLVGLHWAFMEEARRVPPAPVPSCPGIIVHGTRDDIVPIDSSRAYVETNSSFRLVEVDDDHGLATSVDRIAKEAFDLFGLAAG